MEDILKEVLSRIVGKKIASKILGNSKYYIKMLLLIISFVALCITWAFCLKFLGDVFRIITLQIGISLVITSNSDDKDVGILNDWCKGISFFLVVYIINAGYAVESFGLFERTILIAVIIGVINYIYTKISHDKYAKSLEEMKLATPSQLIIYGLTLLVGGLYVCVYKRGDIAEVLMYCGNPVVIVVGSIVGRSLALGEKISLSANIK